MSAEPSLPIDTRCLELPPEFEAKYAEIGKAVLTNAYVEAIQGKRNAYENLNLQVQMTVMIGLKPMLNAQEIAPPPVALEPCGVGGQIHRFWCINVPNFGQICLWAGR
jgi:hypothetical protein